MKLRLSPQTLQVLDAFLQAPKDWKYGYDISRNSGLKSGTLYPILMRLAERKLLERLRGRQPSGEATCGKSSSAYAGWDAIRAREWTGAFARRLRRVAFGGAKG